MSNLINLSNHNSNKNNNMLIVIVLISVIFAIFTWNFLNNHQELEIDSSNNITYNPNNIKNIDPLGVISLIENNEKNNQPSLIYFYVSWCSVCKKQLPVINKIAQKFQNTDLQILVVAIDKDMDKNNIIKHLANIDELYFESFYLNNKLNFKDLLKTKSINFKNRIPFTVLIDRSSKIINQSSGYKSFNYLNKKIIRLLSRNNEV